MNFLKSLARLFTGGSGISSNNRTLSIYLLGRRCNEPFIGQIDLLNELSQTDEGEYPYYARKVFRTTGTKRCFDQVEVELWFDQNKRVAQHEVQGGRWLEADEYEEEVIRFNTPPEEKDPPTAEKSE